MAEKAEKRDVVKQFPLMVKTGVAYWLAWWLANAALCLWQGLPVAISLVPLMAAVLGGATFIILHHATPALLCIGIVLCAGMSCACLNLPRVRNRYVLVGLTVALLTVWLMSGLLALAFAG